MAGQDDSRTSDDETVPKKETDPVDENDGTIAEEYVTLDSKLDELNIALDFLEQKNDDIHKKLKELLESNRAIREELKNEGAGEGDTQSSSN
ncbi:hypothetical protein JYU34_002637 [Plutella xylostella]|uniref:Uncharacterized protein n=2 Tax=Plutella xylostella TaxID=51655 RepID=A0ABQ7R2R8_PLUXY|nr:hypothetical protein JYU34_002637 [Plutella xylostella]CAG9099510.1 unnamed protein product [Plutella xylostella]